MFHKFLYTVGLHRICLRAEVCNLVFIICSLVVGIGCVTDTWKVEWKLHFLEWKTPSLVLSLVHRTHWKSHLFWGIWKITLGYSIQTCWQLQFLMKPLLPLENLKFLAGSWKRHFSSFWKTREIIFSHEKSTLPHPHY